MKTSTICRAVAAALLMAWAAVAQASETTSTDTMSTAPRELKPCEPLPKGDLTDAQLEALVPDGSPGRVRVSWTLESQENTNGFYIYRATNPDGPYDRVNRFIIPGGGTTNIPQSFCFLDTPLTRGATVYYYIEEVTNNGEKIIIEKTKGTKVVVKTVADERAWLRKRAKGEPTAPAPAATKPNKAAAAPVPGRPAASTQPIRLQDIPERKAPAAPRPSGNDGLY